MAHDIQGIFNRIQESKKKQKEIKAMVKDALESNGEYQELQDKMKALKENIKRVEAAVKEGFSSEMQKLDDIKIDIESDTQMLSDMALTEYVNGKQVEVSDEYKNQYEPVFKVNFKKQ